MISRRNFLKLGSVAAVTLAAGFQTGKIISSSAKNDEIIFSGFLPANEDIIKEVIAYIKSRFGIDSISINNFPQELKSLFNYENKSDLQFSIYKSSTDFPCDLIVKKENHSLFTPEEDFDMRLINIRTKLKNEKAAYFFSARKNNSAFIKQLFTKKNDVVRIEDEKGIYDEITLSGKQKIITLNGAFGKTELRIGNGSAAVVSSSCRNKICTKHGAIRSNGELIACAPNKILITII